MDPFLAPETLADDARRSERRARPRVWTVFVAMALAIPTAFVLSSFAIVVAALASGALSASDTEGLMRTLGASFTGVALAIVPAQAAMLVGAVAPAILSPTPWTERLALRRPAIGAASVVLLLGGTLGVIGVVEIVMPLLGEPSEHLRALTLLLSSSSGATAVAIALLVSVLPGVCEELLYRGYAQTRLVARFGAPIGIAIASTLFALSHFDPQHVAGVFPLAVWAGVVAWLASSTWISIGAHVANNLLGVGAMQLFPEGALRPTPVVLLVVAVLCALGALGVVLARRDRAARRAP